MKLRDGTERLVYSTAFVSSFNSQHALGVHAEFRRQADEGIIPYDDVVRLWEESCAHNAVDEAETLVAMHRKGVRSKKEYESRE